MVGTPPLSCLVNRVSLRNNLAEVLPKCDPVDNPSKTSPFA